MLYKLINRRTHEAAGPFEASTGNEAIARMFREHGSPCSLDAHGDVRFAGCRGLDDFEVTALSGWTQWQAILLTS